MDTTLCLLKLAGDTPYKYQGALSDYTPEEYDLIEWIDTRPKPTWEELEAAWPEVEADLARAETVKELEQTDADTVRVVEDLVDLLLGKGVIFENELPPSALEKINARAALRSKLSG